MSTPCREGGLKLSQREQGWVLGACVLAEKGCACQQDFQNYLVEDVTPDSIAWNLMKAQSQDNSNLSNR